MGWRVFGEKLDTADLVSPIVTQRIIPNSDIILTIARTWVIFYNDPVFTSLKMAIYSNDNGLPGKLLAESESLNKSQIITLENGCKELPFVFDDFNMRATDTYHFTIQGVGYVGNWPTDGIAWRKGWPDPVYTENVTTTYNSVGVAPYAIYLIGADF